MPLYRVDRQLGAVTADDVDAAGFRSASCLPHFEELSWVRSYFDPTNGEMTCIYEAARADDIWQHAKMAHIPCDAVVEVREVQPEAYR